MPKKPQDVTLKARDINTILLTARALNEGDGDYQIGVVGMAFKTLCESYGLSKFDGLRLIREAFNTPTETGPISQVAPLQ